MFKIYSCNKVCRNSEVLVKNRLLQINIEENRGSHTVVWYEGDERREEIVYIFANKENSFCGHKIWDIDAIYGRIKAGIKIAYERFPDISETRINTWNYDYVLMCGDMELLPCYSYRDGRITELDEFELGHTTKTGTMPQIIVDMNHGRLRAATDILMMPEYFIYKLTGVKAKANKKVPAEPRLLRFKPEFEAEIGRECRVAVG